VRINIYRLDVFMHMSTAFVNCNQMGKTDVDERLYPLGFDPDAMMYRISKMKPLVIVRPSIVGASMEQPFPGW